MANKEKCWSCGKEFDHDPEDGPPQCEECFRHMCEASGVDPVTGGEIRECEHCHETCVQVPVEVPSMLGAGLTDNGVSCSKCGQTNWFINV